MEWLGVLKEVTAAVRSTLLEAVAEASTVERTLQDGEVQRPVTGEARSGEAKAERVVSATGVTEEDGVSECDDAEGGKPSETTRRSRQAVRPTSLAAKGHEVQRAPRRGRRAMTVIIDTLTGGSALAIAAGAGQGIAVMAGSEANMKDVTGNHDAKLAPTRRK